MKYVGILFLVYLAVGVSLGQVTGDIEPNEPNTPCSSNGCGMGDWRYGKCNPFSLIDAWCDARLCDPAGPCTCCVKKCRNVYCENWGGKCYLEKQDNMKCVQSQQMCKSVPKPGRGKGDLGDLGDLAVPKCWCCKPYDDEPDDCEDKGCSDMWNGQGQCVKVTKEPWAEIMNGYDLRYTNPWVNKKCADPSGGDKDCCLCMKKRTDCKDKGCFKRGGMCVDLKNSYLGNKNSFPLNAVDLGAKIDGDFCMGYTSKQPGCCECYRRKN